MPIVLSEDEVDLLFNEMYAEEGYRLTIDLQSQTVTSAKGATFTFEVDEFRKHCLLNGLDEIGLTLQNETEIKAFEKNHKEQSPWLFASS